MKKLLLLLFFISTTCFSQEVNYKEYSYTEFFSLIDQEKDTVFRLSNALIKFNPDTDQRFKDQISTLDNDSLYNKSELIVIDKHVELNNVQFIARVYNGENKGYVDGAIRFVHFQKKLILKDVRSVFISNCIFSGGFELNLLDCEKEGLDDLTSSYIAIRYSTFKDRFYFFKNCYKSLSNLGYFLMEYNEFSSQFENNGFSLYILNSGSAQVRNNTISSKNTAQFYFSQIGTGFNLENNLIDSKDIYLALEKIDATINLKSNTFSSIVKFEIDELTDKDEVEWEQFKDNLVYINSYGSFVLNETKKMHFNLLPEEREELTKLYLDSVRYYNRSVYANEISIKGLFYKYFKNKYDTESANEVYLELKDFETKRLEILHLQDPGFRSYFKWKVNQFLKLFSDYGTEPSKAIIFSLYVILAFAFIYLLFPNSWDSHGKNRIIDRYAFFFKYMKKDAGIHEVYLEEKSQELMAYDEFRNLIASSEKSVPRFFSATAFPIYKWAISGTKLSASLLSRIDIMQGTWEEMPPAKKAWKSFLLVSVFLIALLYDIFIKMLNALMLSINTFTTLGFGEIPIKGLPRYLAIIQGFIGWFMLTIFSVSLISQLLN